MAYRKRRSTRRTTARRGTYRSVRRGRGRSTRRPVRRATRRVSRARRKSSSSARRIVLVVQHQPAMPTLATPAASAAPRRSRFTA